MGTGDGHVAVLRSAPWVFVAAGGADLFCTLGTVALFLSGGVSLAVIALATVAVFAGSLLAASMVTRISMQGTVLEYRSLGGQGRHEASEISSVGGEDGSRPMLRLKSGHTVPLPGLGRNPREVARIVRSWHQKTASERG